MSNCPSSKFLTLQSAALLNEMNSAFELNLPSTSGISSPYESICFDNISSLISTTSDNSSNISSSSKLQPKKAKKISRERQLKINAASRRTRKKQKMEMEYLRKRVTELTRLVEDHATMCPTMRTMLNDLRENETPEEQAFDEIYKKKSEKLLLNSTSNHLYPKNSGESSTAKSSSTEEELSYLTEHRRRELSIIGTHLRRSIALESLNFCADSISCMPIYMDDWKIRLSITERHFSIHNEKFFPQLNAQDLFDFCWEKSQPTSICKTTKGHYRRVIPIDSNTSYVVSKTQGRWSLNVHGIPNVSFNSLLCKENCSNGILSKLKRENNSPKLENNSYLNKEWDFEGDEININMNSLYQHSMENNHGGGIICQQSILQDKDFTDETTIPWLFKRWVVLKPWIDKDGTNGTMVEAYRTASYATGKCLYSKSETYDSFCEHIIRRYAESNALLEEMMKEDSRFRRYMTTSRDEKPLSSLEQEDSPLHYLNYAKKEEKELFVEVSDAYTSERLVKEILLF